MTGPIIKYKEKRIVSAIVLKYKEEGDYFTCRGMAQEITHNCGKRVTHQTIMNWVNGIHAIRLSTLEKMIIDGKGWVRDMGVEIARGYVSADPIKYGELVGLIQKVEIASIEVEAS